MKKPSPDTVKEILYANAEDLGDVGIDIKTGHGRLTTDFLDVGKIIDDDGNYPYKEPEFLSDLSGCRTGLAIIVIGALIFCSLIAVLII